MKNEGGRFGISGQFSKRFGTWLGILFVSIAATKASRAEGNLKYFRHDGGVTTEAGSLPSRFDAPEHLQWKAAIDSGHSTPVLHNDRIILTTYRAENQELATVALNAKTGEIIWRRPAPVSKIEPFHQQTGNPAVSSPACDGERLYIFFGSSGLICYDLDGNQLWHKRMGPFQDEFGAGSSPILIDNKIILSQDHDVDSFLMALDRTTGDVVWKTARPSAVRSYSTPAVWNKNGAKQVLVGGALELSAYDSSNGEKLWWAHGLARIVIPIPVAAGDMVFMASWAPGGDTSSRITLQAWDQALSRWDKNKDDHLAKNEIDDPQVLDRYYRMDVDQNGKLNQAEWNRHSEVFQKAQNAVLALKPDGRGDLTQSALAWKYQRGAPYVSSPVLDKGVLWMVKDGGIVTKLDAQSGALLHEERLPGTGSYYASPVIGDNKVYFASEQGVISVVANDREWNVVSSHRFGEKIYATPVIDKSRIFIRTDKALYSFGGGKSLR